MTTATAKLETVDQSWMNGTTTYWFDVTGLDCDEGFDYDGPYGVVEGEANTSHLVDFEGFPVINDWVREQVEKVAIVTDEMRLA